MIRRQVLRWTLIGLLIRFLIMPFSFHGHDIFFVYYPPFKFITEGAWNPYLYLKGTFPQVWNPYYPPVIFIIMSVSLFLFKPFLPGLHNLFSTFEHWNFTWEGNTIHFADILIDHQLFRTLFFFKIPYLLFDFGAGWFLFQLLKSDEKKGLLAYKIWMLNPFVLHSSYALGSPHIITAFFAMGSVYYGYLNRRYLATVLLSLTALTTIFPVLLAPFAILLWTDTFKERLKLSITFIITLVAVILPFYLSSPSAVLEALFFSPGAISSLRQFSFVISYFAILFIFFFIRKEARSLDLFVLSFISVLLLFYSFYVVTIRYFILITPLLIYSACRNKRFWVYNIIFLISLFELRTAGNSQQWGLFAALHPAFFSSLPILDSYLNLLVNVKYIHQFMYRLFFVSCLIMVAHILLINRKLFRLALPFGIRYEKI